jgi:endonuclease/exonuclease/phosphatase family metal-dependent hydrolase
MGRELTVATLNLWGLNEPWAYTERRGEVRGAVPGSPAATLRVRGGAWATRRRPLAARALAAIGADIVGLQEDRQDLAGADGRSQSEQLAADLGCGFAYLPNSWDGEALKGNAVLSRYPVRRLETVPLPAAAEEVARFGPGVRDALHAVVETPCGVVHFFVVHLTTRGHAAQYAEAERLLAHVAERAADGTAIVVGDFNAKPDTPTIALLTGKVGTIGVTGAPAGAARGRRLRLRDAWAAANPGEPGHTMLVHTPRTPRDSHMRIDYIFVGPGPEVVRAVLLGDRPDAEGFYASDHFGVAATLRWPPDGRGEG